MQKMEVNSSLAEGGAEVTVIVDRSGSMSSIAREVESGLREFASGQPAGTLFNVVQFDDTYEVVFSRVPAAVVQDFRIQPRSMTALHDAIGKTITDLKAKYAFRRPEKVVVLVLSDGLENASREFDGAAVGKLIEECQGAGWQITFLGANQNAITTARGIGVSHASSLTFGANATGVRRAIRSSLRATSNYLAGNSASICYDAADRSAQVEAGVAEELNSE